MSNNKKNLPSRIQKSVKQNRWMPVWGGHPRLHRSSTSFWFCSWSRWGTKHYSIVCSANCQKCSLYEPAFQLRSPQNMVKETFTRTRRLTNRKTTFGLLANIITLFKKVKWWFAKHVMVSAGRYKGSLRLIPYKVTVNAKRETSKLCHPDLLKSASLFYRVVSFSSRTVDLLGCSHGKVGSRPHCDKLR